MKRIILLALITALSFMTLTACTNPRKVSLSPIGLCTTASSSLQGIPYTKISSANCAVAISPFDLSLWHKAPMNSYKSRGARFAELGCQPLTPAVDNCSYCGPSGHSTTLMMNFDPTVYASGSNVQRAVLAVYSPGQAHDLRGAYLRGRLNIGDALTSLARQRTVVLDSGNRSMVSDSSKKGRIVYSSKGDMVLDPTKLDDGWVLFDVTFFVARAINERRNSIHFEISFPCQTPADNQVMVGVNSNEPQLVVEFN